MSISHKLQSRRIGLALSGGAIRGVAHIGVLKALAEYGLQPAVVAGTSAGSLIGAAVAAGMDWRELTEMAHDVFWPSLLNGRTLEKFCARRLPANFKELQLPFAAVATVFPARQPVTLASGDLASALSASCAVWARRPVRRDGAVLKDGGFTCVLPSQVCRDLGAEFVIASDVWEVSAFLRGVGLVHTGPLAHRAYPRHFVNAVRNSDLLIQPSIPVSDYWPGHTALDRLIAAGEAAARRALAGFVGPA